MQPRKLKRPLERLNKGRLAVFCSNPSKTPSGEISTNNRDEQEISILSMHLLQVCLVYINTLLIQQVLADPEWLDRLKEEDLRALSPLIYGHVNPYGRFFLDMDQRLSIGN